MGSEVKILLYIVFGIVYLLYSFYNKEKKKQDQKRMGKRPVSQKSAEDIFKELQKALQIPESKPEPAQTVVVKKETVQRKAKKVEMFIPERPKMKYYKPVTASKFSKQPEMAANKVELDMHETEYSPDIQFDARKAVIFAEILKRPEY